MLPRPSAELCTRLGRKQLTLQGYRERQPPALLPPWHPPAAPWLEAAQGEARHRGAGRTALVVLAPLLSAASPPKNGEHSWARSWDRRSRQGNMSPSQPRPSIPKNMKGSGRGCPCSPSPVVLGILQKDAPALPARTWLKDQLSRHLSQERNPRGWGCAPNLGQPAGRCVKAALHPHHIREEQGLGEVLHSH